VRRARLGSPARVAAAVAMLLAAIFSAAPADASGLRLAAAASPRSSGGTWGTAVEVPGTAALNKGGDAGMNSVSCASAGNCSGGGTYAGAGGHIQVFVVNESSGKWGTAVEVPGTAALNKDGFAFMYSVSCASAGNCSAGGYYKDASGSTQAFVVNESGGKWGTAVEVPGTAALNTGGDAFIYSVSCGSAGNCSAGGSYLLPGFVQQAFVVGESGGKWGTAVKVPFTAALDEGSAVILSVSCASAGNCGAGGYYTDGVGHQQAFVVSESGGKWGTAVEVPGTAALNTGGGAQISSVSCASAGNCSAGGQYEGVDGSPYDLQAFVVTESGGKWGTAVEVPGTAAVNTGGDADVISVSCASAGHCSAGGQYTGATGGQAFVVGET
jgi:hypothetical protein